MSSKRKTYSAEFKARVALEAIRGEMTVNQIAARYEVHPSQVTQWKKQALEHLKDSFSSRRAKAQKQDVEHSKTNSTARSDDSRWSSTG